MSGRRHHRGAGFTHGDFVVNRTRKLRRAGMPELLWPGDCRQQTGALAQRPGGCGGTQTTEARLTRAALSVTPTVTEIPPTNTATATATVTARVPTNTATKSPSETPSRTPYVTPTDDSPRLRYCVNAYSVNVRSGPGRKYGVFGNLRGEDCLYFDGSNVEGTWLRIADRQIDSKYRDIEHGWVYIELLGLLENSILPAMTLTPTPTLTPTYTLTPSPTQTPSPTWTSSPTLTLTPTPTVTPTTAG